MNSFLLEHMACPRHHTALSPGRHELTCSAGCHFPVVDGVPVMLLEEAQQCMEAVRASLRQASEPNTDGGLYLESIGLSSEQRLGIRQLASTNEGEIDPVVAFLVAATNGIAYKDQVGKLKDYPIPTLRLPPAKGRVFVDIGCSWGRWCVAASRMGYKVIGIEPSLGAVMAAKRVARQLGIEAAFIVGDARYLPLKSSAIDQVFSYSVLQHLSREDVGLVATEIGRILNDSGRYLLQMPTKSGLRCIYHQLRRQFRDGSGFEVRYWSLPSLRRLFTDRIGATKFSVDCFFGIGLQYSDLSFMTPLMKGVVTTSEILRLVSNVATPLVWVADSVYVSGTKQVAVPGSTQESLLHRNDQ
jgi:SAM-dependent methyltransferase/uncharacterized protein YbaR (Trm112 family)